MSSCYHFLFPVTYRSSAAQSGSCASRLGGTNPHPLTHLDQRQKQQQHTDTQTIAKNPAPVGSDQLPLRDPKSKSTTSETCRPLSCRLANAVQPGRLPDPQPLRPRSHLVALDTALPSRLPRIYNRVDRGNFDVTGPPPGVLAANGCDLGSQAALLCHVARRWF